MTFTACWKTGLGMELRAEPFFYVLKAGLWEEVPASSLKFSQSDWTSILDRARAHSVLALIADGSNLLPKENKPSLLQIAELVASDQVAEKGNKLVDAVLKQMAAYWQKEGVDAVLLKGQGLAYLYPNPLHRTPGDIDWYFPGKENFRKALALVQAKGLCPRIDGDGDFHYSVNGVIIEHHKKWCDISSPLKQGRVSVIEKEYGFTQGPGYRIPSALTNLIQLNVHILKHLLVMGVGWRQLCDLALATKHYCGQYDPQKYRLAVNSLGLMKWSRLLYGVLAEYLGVEPAWMPLDPGKGKDVDRLAKLIMDCGNFGRESGKRMVGSYLTAATLLCRYVPGEVLWRLLELAGNRFGQLFRRM